MPPVILLDAPFNAETGNHQVVSNLCPFEHIAIQKFMQTQQAIQESIQREAQAVRAVQSLNVVAAHTASAVQSLAQTSAKDVALFIKENNEHLQKMVSSLRALSSLQPRIDPLWEENERAQRLLSSCHPLIDLRWKEAQEQLQRLAASFHAIDTRLQQEALRDYERLQGLAASLATLLPISERVPHIHIDQAALERRMCADALQIFAYEPEHAKRFVQALGLPLSPSFLCAVWEALREGRWMNADNPLRYVRSVAYRIYKQDKEQNESLFNSTCLSLDAGPTGALLPPPLHASCNPWPELEDRCDKERLLEQQGLSAGLSSDALMVYKLREIHGQHISRRTLPDMLQWTPKRVERAWREMCRKIGPRKKLG